MTSAHQNRDTAPLLHEILAKRSRHGSGWVTHDEAIEELVVRAATTTDLEALRAGIERLAPGASASARAARATHLTEQAPPVR